MPSLRTVRVTRYVTPLREGGSLPAIVEADDDGMYVLKFRGAGHGARALIAELVAGEIARALALPVPELVFAELDPDLARTEPDPEIHALIRESAGLNLALDYLPGSVAFDPVVERPAADLASRVVWFDAYVSNVDRSARNTNMLMWHRRIWLIDHGSSLYFHHAPSWWTSSTRAQDPFPAIRNHVLLRAASLLDEADERLSAMLTPAILGEIVDLIPPAWLADGAPSGPERARADDDAGPRATNHAPQAADASRATPGAPPATVGVAGKEALREAYTRYLVDRLTTPRLFVEEARRAR